MAHVIWHARLYNRTTGALITNLDSLFERSLTYKLNDVDQMDFSTYLDDAQAALIVPLRTVIRVWRETDDGSLGPPSARPTAPDAAFLVGSYSKSAEANTAQWTAYSPLWRLQSRYHIDPHNFSDASKPSAVKGANGPREASDIMWRMISFTNQVVEGTLGDATGIVKGSLFEDSPPKLIERKYDRGQNSWEMIQDLLIGGVDLKPTYLNRGDYGAMAFNTVLFRGVQNNSVKFEYGTGSKNCSDISERIMTDPGSFSNYVTVQGESKTDADQTNVRNDALVGADGLYMRFEMARNGVTAAYRLGLAQQYLLRGKNPVIMYEPTVSPAMDAPIYGVDFHLGDGVRVSCSRGAGMTFTNQWQRVIEVKLDLSDGNMETCSPTLIDDYNGQVSP